MRLYTCHICRDTFAAGHKKSDPERNVGEGTCLRCREVMIDAMVKYGYGGQEFTEETAREYLKEHV